MSRTSSLLVRRLAQIRLASSPLRSAEYHHLVFHRSLRHWGLGWRIGFPWWFVNSVVRRFTAAEHYSSKVIRQNLVFAFHLSGSSSFLIRLPLIRLDCHSSLRFRGLRLKVLESYSVPGSSAEYYCSVPWFSAELISRCALGLRQHTNAKIFGFYSFSAGRADVIGILEF